MLFLKKIITAFIVKTHCYLSPWLNIISKWAGELIVSLVIVTILEMLLPDNKIKKYVKTVIGVYIIFCVISPFIDENEIENILEHTEKNLEKIEMQSQITSSQNDDSSIETLYIQEFQKDVIKKVEELGYQVRKCEVDIEIDATKENAGINAIYLSVGNKMQNMKDEKNTNIEIEEIETVEISINNQEAGNNNDEEIVENDNSKEIKEFLSNYYEINEECIIITQK